MDLNNLPILHSYPYQEHEMIDDIDIPITGKYYVGKYRGYCLNGWLYGEYKCYNSKMAHLYLVKGKTIIDLSKTPITDPEDKIFLTLKYGGPWLEE